MSGPAYDPNQPPPPKSSNSWIWITLLVLLVLLVGCGGICGGCFWWAGKTVRQGAQNAMQSIELLALQASAINAINGNEEVSSKIGNVTSYDTPTLVGAYGMEQQTISCKFAIRGERETATATVTGTREAGSLRPTDIQVKFGDGTTVEVPPGEFTPDLNFDIGPEDGMPAEESMPDESAEPTTDEGSAETNDSN